tara:strand:- start:273 stop:515 length:243 start_codon:yes stop_codon:yes gene_type:complete
MKKKIISPKAIITASLALGLSTSLTSCSKPGLFGVQEADTNSQPEQAEHKCGEGKCGEGKCGDDHKCGEDHQCGEGKCGH